MKKNLFIVAAVALVAMVSCNKEEVNNAGVDTTPEPAVVVEFEAGFNADTKTALDATGKKTLWEADDLISINGQQFKIKELLNDGANAVFVNVNNLPTDFAAPFTAVYPYGSNGIPATQTAKANTFDPAAAIETATSDNNTLVFENQSSLLKFQVPAACSSVSLTADENLAQDSKTVTISGNFAAGTDYYVAVLPGTKTNFVARIDGYVSRNAATVTIAKSSIVNMKTLPAPVIRLYIQCERTPFDLNLYTWDSNETKYSGDWPGTALTWDNTKQKYYYDFPINLLNTELNYIINNGVYQTGDESTKFSSQEQTEEAGLKWVYFKPSDNWKKDGAWFAAKFSGGDGEYWMWPLGPNADGVYGFAIPSTRTKVQFNRMDANKKDYMGDNVWNYTNELDIPTDGKNYFNCTCDWWNLHSNDTWSNYSF